MRHPGIGGEQGVLIPVVAEYDDSYLHDARGFHLTHEHVYAALDSATGGPVAEAAWAVGPAWSASTSRGHRNVIAAPAS